MAKDTYQMNFNAPYSNKKPLYNLGKCKTFSDLNMIYYLCFDNVILFAI